ncbi:MAG: hypothetical protein K2J63_01345 [Muribaculaceae bacterium]|nr:hypothetical protein [Muribaculaceae bacterium]
MTHKDILPPVQKIKKIIPGMITLPSVTKKDSYSALNKLLKDELYSLNESLSKLIRKDKVTLSPLSSKSTKGLFTAMASEVTMRSLLKDQLITIYTSYSSEILNVPAVAAIDKKIEKFWKTMLQTYELSLVQVVGILGREITVKHYYGWGSNFLPEVLFFPLEVTYYAPSYYYYDSSNRKDRIYFQLSTRYRRLLNDYFFGPGASTAHLYKNLPADKNLKIENFELQIATDLVTLAGLALNGSLLNSNGSISGAVVKRIKKQSKMREFIPTLDEWPLDRVELLSFTYFFELKKEGKKGRDISVTRFIQFATDTLPELLSATQFNSFFPAFQGFTKTWAEKSYAKELASVVKSLLLPAQEEWMDMDNFRLRFLSADCVEELSIFKLFRFNDIEKNNLRRRSEKENNDNDSKAKEKIDWFEDIGYRFALHWIKYLCALGMVEIAMDGDVKDVDSDPLEGMRFVKLTALGRYAYGIDKEYTPATADDFGGVEFDSINGIITLANADSPYSMFLSTVAKQISPIRFKISVESLMKGCRKRSELENRIVSLKSVINTDKEPALLAIVKEALTHTECAEREGGYSLLKLKRNIPGLVELIATNKDLRNMTLLTANRSMVLVKTVNLEKFYSICAANGYLME